MHSYRAALASCLTPLKFGAMGCTASVNDSDERLLRSALRGDESSLRELVERLTPVIQVRVARVLLRQGRRSREQIGPEVADATQEVFLALFAERGRVLGNWDPARGLSLANFVGLVAQRLVSSIVRSGRKNPWLHEPEDPAEFDRLSKEAEPTPESVAASREDLRRVLDALRGKLSPLGLEMFQRLYVARESLEEIRAATGLTDSAIYQWRSRLGKAAQQAFELEPPVLSRAPAAIGNEAAS
jgi:RNA polymerase sigma-70 factor (ECF subfamily)